MLLKFDIPGKEEKTRYEKIHNVIFESWSQSAKEMVLDLKESMEASSGEFFTIALEASTTLKGFYNEFIKSQKILDLSKIHFFSTGEFLYESDESFQSCAQFLHEHFFSKLNINDDQIHLLNGSVLATDCKNYVAEYEEMIKKWGIDYAVLRVGSRGKLSFNQPGANSNSVTRRIVLDEPTKHSSEFLSRDSLVTDATTIGLQTILNAKRVLAVSFGNKNANSIKSIIEDHTDILLPASILQAHSNATLVLDTDSASELTKISTPWLVSNENWNDEASKLKAIVWLCEKTKKSILRLTDYDYNTNHLASLLEAENGSAYTFNIKVFNKLHKSITGWPGGKPGVNDKERPERSTPAKKRVIIFSPHPDDDVISMGGTFDRLVQQGHEVHVAYQTSGNIAVSNAEARRFVEVSNALLPSDRWNDFLQNLAQQTPQLTKSLLDVKGTIRQFECFGAIRYFGVPDSQIHFLNLPFYETGKIEKNPISQCDIDIMKKLIEEVQPHQIYVAGDLADPHGTHKVCLEGFFQAIEQLKGSEALKECWIWLYRGAWHEFDIHEIDMAVPMSPDQVLRKRKAIFFHQSQKDGVMFQGDDAREFWVRAEERNKVTAERYHALGFADYAALEAFQRYHF